MTYATNPLDGVRVWFEDEGGAGPAVLLYPGFTDPLEYARGWRLAHQLREDFRLIFVDHRGQGRSDKPHSPDAYALRTRSADPVAVLDELSIEHAHFIGLSWGGRLGFALAEHAPERLLSLVVLGNQPYEWNLEGPMARAVEEAIQAGRRGGMEEFVQTWESSLGIEFPEPSRTWMLTNDPVALEAAFRSIRVEGPISRDLTTWNVPCLICVGTDDEMHDDAARAAAEIPNAIFLALPGHTHFSAESDVDALLPHVLRLFRSTSSQQ